MTSTVRNALRRVEQEQFSSGVADLRKITLPYPIYQWHLEITTSTQDSENYRSD
jgi:hypothetical protein